MNISRDVPVSNNYITMNIQSAKTPKKNKCHGTLYIPNLPVESLKQGRNRDRKYCLEYFYTFKTHPHPSKDDDTKPSHIHFTHPVIRSSHRVIHYSPYKLPYSHFHLKTSSTLEKTKLYLCEYFLRM